MKLKPQPFKLIKEGDKTIELRLYDEKRQQISVGDQITFVNTENKNEELIVRVEALYIFKSFDELYQNLPLSECGYAKSELKQASSSDMEQYYSKEMQQRYGVVEIKISKR